MKKDVFNVLLLQALPASGKSEVRNFMANMDPEVLRKEFHVGENLQLDDFPYVFFMRRIDEILEEMGQPRIYYPGEDPFIDGRDWGTLSHLLNEDYHDLINRNVVTPSSYAEYLFERIDRASLMAGLAPRISQLDEDIRKKVAVQLEDLAKDMTLSKINQYTEDLEGKTIVIENSRGGKDGSSMPLTGTQGYQYSLPNYCPEILENAAILYIWVTPEESRRKNAARYNPDDPGSNLNHMTPVSVMMYDYGCDDMIYLKETSEKEDTVTVVSHGKKYYVPIAVIDNRVDLTTMFRDTPDKWDSKAVEDFTKVTRTATDTMWKNYK